MDADAPSRFDRLDTYIAEDRILRGAWFDADGGRERACLLVALAPEVGEGMIFACPASLLPPWLAYLTPSLDDGVSLGAWPEVIRNYARTVRRGATTLDASGWRRVQARFLLAVLAEVPSPESEVVAALWRRVLAGDEPPSNEWAKARHASWNVSMWARDVSTWAVDAGTPERRAVTAQAVAAAAWAASRAVTAVAASVRSAAASWAAAAADASPACWDRMARALFAAIETECGEQHEPEGDGL